MITNLSDLSVINYNQCITVRYLQCTAKSMDPETLAQCARRRCETSQHTINAVLLILTYIIAVIVPMLIDMLQPYYLKQPYHTSVLSGYGWVMEMLNGHPERIQTELGVHKHVFLKLLLFSIMMTFSKKKKFEVWPTVRDKSSQSFVYAHCHTG